MTGSPSTARAFPLLLAAAVLCSGARLCAAAGDKEDTIKPSEFVAQVHPIFVQLQAAYPDEHMPRIIQRIDRQFGERIRGQSSNYSQSDVDFVKSLIPYTVEFAKTYRDIARGPDSPDKGARIEEAKARYNDQVAKLIAKEVTTTTEQMQSAGASAATIQTTVAGIQHTGATFAMPLQESAPPPKAVVATPPAIPPTQGVSAPPATPPSVDQDQSALAKTLLDSVRGAFGRGDHPGQEHAGGNASIPGLGQVIGLPSNNSDPSSVMGSVGDQLLKGDISGALASANRAVELGGGADALTLRGGIELDQQSFSKANQDAKSALKLNPNDAEASAIAHFSEGRSDGIASSGPSGTPAASAAAGGGGGGSSASSGFGGYGSGGGSSGDGAAGRGSVSGSLGLSVGGPAGAGLAGLSSGQAQKGAADALALGDLGGAMAFVNRGLAQNPRDPGLLNMRSSIFSKQHDYKSAIADAKAGLLLDPKNADLLRSLGFAQLRDKDFQAALATANEMLELNPNDPYAYALRGHAYGSLGDRDAMMADLQRAAELDPSFAAAAKEMGGKLQLPEDKDLLFLFPGEEAASAARTAAPASGRGRRFGLLVGASALGGLLLALGLLATVLAPLKEKVTSAFTRITRTGPTVAAMEVETDRPASANGLMPGLIRGQYEIARQIGVGGMGVVYAGTDRALGRPVAIKKMRDEVRFDAREKARFVSEAKTVAALHHPNIVDIYAIAEDGDDVFLVFEYVDGRTVHDLVQASGKLEPEQAAKVVRASADALEYAHARGVIHRDMKPSNVMLDRAGLVKVMDFGIARMAKDTLLRQSATNTVAGTPPYMAPEQEQGQVRKESDVYALAICAYEMLTGKLPFVGTGGGMLLNKINMSYVAPSREAAGLPAGLDPVFERAFQADPDKRFPTPRAFADALESALPAAVRAA